MDNNKTTELIENTLEELRPAFLADGGDIELVDFDEEKGVVFVKLEGACASCPMSTMTLQFGIQAALKEKLDWVKDVVPVEEDN